MAALCELIKDLHSVLSPSCVAETQRSGEGFQVCLDCCDLRLQLASSSPAPRARLCGQMEVFDQLTIETSRSMIRPAKHSLDELRRHTSETEAVPLFHRRYEM